jgi:glycyl-tRNA synthetase
MDTIVNLAKRRGFAFQSSEIYGGIRSSYDYGPLGVELKNNIKKAWWRSIVQLRDDVVGQDAAIIMAPAGLGGLGPPRVVLDPLVECTNCHQRFREDHLIEAFEAKHGRAPAEGELKCPNCGGGPFTDPRNFNLMFKTFMGPVEDDSAVVWLRPETAQGIFVDFPIIQQVSRKKIPFGIAQIGKAFRNEITPGTSSSGPGVRADGARVLRRAGHRCRLAPALDRHAPRLVPGPGAARGERAHSASTATRSWPTTPSGRSTSSTSSRSAGRSWRGSPTGPTSTCPSTRSSPARTSPTTTRRPTPATSRTWSSRRPAPTARPWPSWSTPTGRRRPRPPRAGPRSAPVLRFDPRLAPIKAAVLPLSRNEQLNPMAREVAGSLRERWMIDYDDARSIGRRYRRQDEIGTPFCVTVDFDSLQDRAVTGAATATP